MNIALIGHTVIDYIYQGEDTYHKPGGLFYTTAGMLNIIDDNAQIFPVTTIQEKYSDILLPVYGKVRNDFISRDKVMPVVHLTIKEIGEREERYENLTDKLLIDSLLESGIIFDGILINMITGFDIDLEDLTKIRNKFDCPVYLDVHSLARGIDDENKRFFREIPDKKMWLSNVDIVQANEYELECLSSVPGELNKAKEILANGIGSLIITKGNEGAVLYTGKDEIIRYYVTADKNSGSNAVGCGDIFGAAFFYSYICGNSNYGSLRFANAAAGSVTNYFTYEDYRNLKNDIHKRID